MTTVKDSINFSPPTKLPDLLRKLAFGDILRQSIKTDLHRQVPALDAAQLGTLQQIGLPDDARAGTVVRAYSRVSGNMVTGELTPVAPNTTPMTGQIAVAPNGDIVVLAADQITDMDVEYQPKKGDVVTFVDLPAAANIVTLPASVTAPGAVYLIDANVTAGTITGRKIVVAPGTAAAAGKASFNAAKTTIVFHGNDGPTKVTVRLLVVPAVNVSATLEANADY